MQQLRANPAFNTGLVATLIHDPEQSRSGHERLAYLQAVAQEGALITPMTFIDHTPWPMVPPHPRPSPPRAPWCDALWEEPL